MDSTPKNEAPFKVGDYIKLKSGDMVVVQYFYPDSAFREYPMAMGSAYTAEKRTCPWYGFRFTAYARHLTVSELTVMKLLGIVYNANMLQD